MNSLQRYQGLAHGYYISRLQREKTGAHPYGALKTGALPHGRAIAPCSKWSRSASSPFRRWGATAIARCPVRVQIR
jgi:hypothetical protein